jgi:peptidoglycan/LPS O-acetylase OafA/YrhL
MSLTTYTPPLPRARWAWLVPLAGLSAVGWTDHWLADQTDPIRAFGIFGLVGIALGWGWYRLSPRTFAARMLTFAQLFVLVAVFAIVGGGDHLASELTPSVGALLGVLAGLAMTEQRRDGGALADQRLPRATALQTAGGATADSRLT